MDRRKIEAIAAARKMMRSALGGARTNSLEASLTYLCGTIGILKRDTDRCEARYRAAQAAFVKNQWKTLHERQLFELRLLIRVFFAEVEGTLFAARRVILWEQARGGVVLDQAEIDMVRAGLELAPDGTHEAPAKGRFLSTTTALALVLKQLPRVFGLEAGPEPSGAGWESFGEAVRTRNAITHPKEVLSLVIDVDVALNHLPTARRWYCESLSVAAPDPRLKKTLLGDRAW